MTDRPMMCQHSPTRRSRLSRRFWTTAAALAGSMLLSNAIATAADAPGAPAGDAAATAPTQQELQQKLQELQERLRQLEARQVSPAAADAAKTQAQVTNDTVERVLRDADKRSQLMQLDEGPTAGYTDGRFMIGTADGSFTFKPMAQLQFRNITVFNTAGDDDIENGFEVRRAKFGFDGNAFNKDFYYYFLWATSSSTGGVSLEQAWVRYKFADNLAIRLGQFVDPAIHEQNVSSRYQLAVERSLLTQIIAATGESFTQGVTAVWDPKPFKFEFGFTDGINTGNTDFRDFPVGPTDFGVVGRAEWYAFGDPKNYGDFTARTDKEDLLVFGAGADWTQVGDTDNLTHTADVQWESTSGLSVYAAYLAQYLHNGAGVGLPGITSADGDTYNWGFMAQVGYLFNRDFEIFGRYDYTHTDNVIAAGTGTEDDFHEITAGFNYYFYGHHAKFTLDLNYLPNGAPNGVGGLDYISSDDAEWILRGQFQFLL